MPSWRLFRRVALRRLGVVSKRAAEAPEQRAHRALARISATPEEKRIITTFMAEAKLRATQRKLYNALEEWKTTVFLRNYRKKHMLS